jgi:hypothetical protein
MTIGTQLAKQIGKHSQLKLVKSTQSIITTTTTEHALELVRSGGEGLVVACYEIDVSASEQAVAGVVGPMAALGAQESGFTHLHLFIIQN